MAECKKIRYASRAHAKTATRRKNAKDGMKTIYKCDICGSYHLSRMSKAEAKRVRKRKRQ